ncbi:MAG: sulfotransferase family protein [Actinomycetales bacterium]
MLHSSAPGPIDRSFTPPNHRTSPFPPDFLILGAQKSGTTSLAAALRSHPDVFVPRAKEAQHFGRVPDDEAGGPAYRAFFGGWSGQRVVGEATPNYLSSATAAAQIARVLPRVKCIVVLRNPVDRAYSAFWNGRRVGRVRTDFATSIEQELGEESPTDAWFTDLVEHGRYAEQLQQHLDLGLESDRLLVVIFEEMVGDEARTLQTVQEFLAVDPLLSSLSRQNEASRSWLPRPVRSLLAPHYRRRAVARINRLAHRPFTPPPMDPGVRARLVEYFRPHNARLAELLGRDLPDWDR